MANMSLVFTLLLALLINSLQVGAQQGFINLDCGLPPNSNYTNEVGYVYISDDAFIASGESKQVAAGCNVSSDTIYQTLRSFPNYQRNCYVLVPVTQGIRYLIRASFMYGNYDGLNRPPSFDIYLNSDFWYTLKFDNDSHIVWTEIIGKARSSMTVCLININGGTPFISGLELRPLDNDTYSLFSSSDALLTYERIDTGSVKQQRFKDDPIDRIWTPDYNAYGAPRNTTKSVQFADKFKVPLGVGQTAVVSTRPIVISWTAGKNMGFYIFFYFEEVQEFPVKQTRNITITLNGKIFMREFPIDDGPTVIYENTPMNQENYTFSIYVSRKSTLGPLINAFEIYKIYQVSRYATFDQDVIAITDIKVYYKLKRNWGGDPCLPDISWDGLNCSYENPPMPRITYLDLSYSGLNGTITDAFSNLAVLSFLNLSGNQLTGQVPEFFAPMMKLTTLDLSYNKLTGSLPKALRDRVKNGTLTLRTEGNFLSNQAYSHKTKNCILWTMLFICFTLVII